MFIFGCTKCNMISQRRMYVCMLKVGIIKVPTFSIHLKICHSIISINDKLYKNKNKSIESFDISSK